jgi:tetratricopeptide (TPR) repeat protein
MHTIGLEDVLEGVQSALKDKRYNTAEQFLWPALDQRPENGALWFYAGVLSALYGRNALAVECFQKSYALEPHQAIWANLGGTIRSMNVDLSRKVLEMGLERTKDDPHLLANLCGSYVNEGNPDPGIEYGERCMDLPEGGPEARFNLALLYLEKGNFARGFDLYAIGHHRLREQKTYDPDPPELTPELHEQLKGKGKRLIVHGEQGIGDEMMFATMFADIKKDYHVIFDCHPRLESLYKTASWYDSSIKLFPTRKTDDKGWSVEADAKSSIGNMARYYRRQREDFALTGPVYKANPTEVAEMRAHLLRLANGRKIIGLALNGGTMSTARTYRSMHPDLFDDLFKDDRYFFVSLDYEDMTNHAGHINKKYGEGKYTWFPSVCWAWDYHHQAALVAATDAVITVCQSIAHLSAAMGHPTYVLTPSRPAWRYGLTGEQWNWYPLPNVRLLRQTGDNWEPAFTALKESLQAHLFQSEVA